MSFSGLLNVEDNTERISNVAARNRRILFDYRATGRDELLLGGLNVRYKEIKDWPMFLALFDV
jgi:hypothetical protein